MVNEVDSQARPSGKNAHWQEPLLTFAQRVYSEIEVKRWCLQLQDEYHVNVNILLWTFWLQKENLKVASYWLDDVLISIDTTSQLTVNRLREIRYLIKKAPDFTKVQSQQVCKHILNAEISAERIFLRRLQDLSARFIEANSQSGSVGIRGL
jgi:uncharacterized protein (TIGR02444 family)